MQYGLIGGRLGHSFSKEIHEGEGLYTYDLVELRPDELESFIKKADFKGINVTIPYKEAVMPLLDYISPDALAIGAVNTIVNENGRLCGYNTDFSGLLQSIELAGIGIKGKKTVVLGAGGAAKTAYAVARHCGASSVVHATRHPKEGQIALSEIPADTQIFINATPVGMFPDIFERVVDLGRFEQLEGVADCIYNPLRSNLILDAKKRGIPAIGGLYMLVTQAYYAMDYFLHSDKYKSRSTDCYNSLLKEKENIALCGMPSCGKSTIGKQMASERGRRFIDTDALIVERIGMPIADFFKSHSESEFRDIESDVIREVASLQGCVIALGGGAVLRDENVHNLKMNSRIVYIDRKLEELIPTSDRPLSSDIESLTKLYNERLPIYRRVADETIANHQ